jgi:prevent-host-death family protein
LFFDKWQIYQFKIGWAENRKNALFFSVFIWYDKKTGGENMNISTDIRSITYLKSKTADMLDQVNETRRPVVITQNGEPKAILIDPQSYQQMRNAIGLLKLLSQGENDIKKERIKSNDDVFEHLDQLLNGLENNG